jgi:hypothetical protein
MIKHIFSPFFIQPCSIPSGNPYLQNKLALDLPLFNSLDNLWHFNSSASTAYFLILVVAATALQNY